MEVHMDDLMAKLPEGMSVVRVNGGVGGMAVYLVDVPQVGGRINRWLRVTLCAAVIGLAVVGFLTIAFASRL
jgi:hypothetical protein